MADKTPAPADETPEPETPAVPTPAKTPGYNQETGEFVI